MSLSNVERRILLNQYKIMAALFPAEAEHYDGLAQILAEGYHEKWADAIIGDLQDPLPEEDTGFVFDVLVLYDWLQRSFYSLSMADRQTIDEKRLRFPGFDAGVEKRLGAYARFLMQRTERFTFLSASSGSANNAPLRPAYARMLAALPKVEDRNLTASEIRFILDAAAKRPAAPAPKLSRSVTPEPATAQRSAPAHQPGVYQSMHHMPPHQGASSHGAPNHGTLVSVPVGAPVHPVSAHGGANHPPSGHSQSSHTPASHSPVSHTPVNRPAAAPARGALALKPAQAAVLPKEVFEPTPELAAFEAALNASLAREAAFSYFRD